MFIAERPPQQDRQVVLGMRVADEAAFKPPASGAVKKPFANTHWRTRQMLLADPDGRVLSIEAPRTIKARSPKKRAPKRKAAR